MPFFIIHTCCSKPVCFSYLCGRQKRTLFVNMFSCCVINHNDVSAQQDYESEFGLGSHNKNVDVGCLCKAVIQNVSIIPFMENSIS